MCVSKSRTEDGASSVEYGLLVAFIATVIVVAVFAVGGLTNHMFSMTCDRYAAAAATSASCT